ncbi:nitrate- and nitrite sensing domain-containing protein [Solwaraspora sp. WMMD1047]|uniref:sensor histidine kinase n=1 Tax=Solwaraspora sp. WMMD1047 TaxID=3016102 RepID=UPI002415D3C9|nr:nitrate- and nitrite sensing domain-containing protein [Solwaraspora sp. WMMD1047]MDG4828873.1 nitrate- and nitrite sensing domain-containing protein [Solwaraspora sp. WMMD1047]
MNTRNWPIRSKIVALVAAPIAALLALWIFATTLTVGPASSLLAAQTLLDELGKPGEAMVAELQRERRLSTIYLAGRDNTTELAEQRVRTDAAITEFRRRTTGEELTDVATGLVSVRLAQTYTALDALSAGRGFIDRRDMDAAGAIGLYSGMIDTAFRTFSAMLALPDESLNREARALTALGRAREVLGQTDALLAGSFTAERFGDGEYTQLVQIIGTQRFLLADAVAELPDAGRAEYQRMTESDAFVRLRAMEEQLVANGRPGAPVPVDARAWQSSYDSVQRQLRDFELAGAEALTERTVPVAIGILARLGLAGVLGFLAVLLSMIIAVRIGRSLARRLSGLRAAAQETATERLPSVVGRLRRGEDVNLDREVPALDHGGDEIGEVARAFSEVQQTAIRSAIDEAALRRGLNDVFLNIARRSQTLLHRQLALLDRMERRTTEPDELADLFKVDHLATRMRRHAEDLVILAGATPGRGWRNPVPMVDVIRGAISEIEDYARVDIATVQPAAAVGRAVGDVVHLLAELIENAASFSPPHTRIRVSGEVLPNGYAIEIEDRGLGMPPEALTEANQRLADPPEFDPTNSARLGLFVVAQLGARHGVKVQLRTSAYGGVTAVALIPSDIVVAGTGTLALPGRPPLPLGPSPAGVSPAAAGAAPTARPGPPRGRDLDSTVEFVLTGDQLAAQTPPNQPPVIQTPVSQTPAIQTPAIQAPATPTSAIQAPAVQGPAHRDSTSPASATRAGSGEPVPAGPVPAGPVPAESGPAGPAGPSRPAEVQIGEDGLPRRVRQTSLAPQLRKPQSGPPGRAGATQEMPRRPGNGRPPIVVAEAPPPPRTPEEVRSVMAALQSGTARGRRDATVEPTESNRTTQPGPAASTGTGAPATDEGSPHSGRNA